MTAWLSEARSQMTFFIVCAMTIVGPFNAIYALGGAGLKDHLTSTKLNVVYTASMSMFGWVAGAFYNRFGARILTCLAAMCYLSYVVVIGAVSFLGASALYAFPCGVVVGFGASLMWSTFGAVGVSYPRLEHQSRSFATLWSFMNLGGFFAGCLSLMINYSQKETIRADLSLYLTLGCLIITGMVVAGSFLRHQNTIVRSDGVHVGVGRASLSMKQIFSNILDNFRDTEAMLLWLLFMTPYAHMPFLFNGLNSAYFNIRSRALNSALYWAARIPAGLRRLIDMGDFSAQYSTMLSQIAVIDIDVDFWQTRSGASRDGFCPDSMVWLCWQVVHWPFPSSRYLRDYLCPPKARRNTTFSLHAGTGLLL